MQGDKSKRGYVPQSYVKPYTPSNASMATASSKAKEERFGLQQLQSNNTSNNKTNKSPSYTSPTSNFYKTSSSPTSYSNVGSGSSSNVLQMETAVPPANSTKLGPIRRLSDPRLPGYLEEVGGSKTMAITQMNQNKNSTSPTSSSNQPKMPMPSQNINDEFSNLISLHDDWLKNMQEAHQDAFRGMVRITRSYISNYLFNTFLFSFL